VRKSGLKKKGERDGQAVLIYMEICCMCQHVKKKKEKMKDYFIYSPVLPISDFILLNEYLLHRCKPIFNGPIARYYQDINRDHLTIEADW
jgi:hypothetical protein